MDGGTAVPSPTGVMAAASALAAASEAAVKPVVASESPIASSHVAPAASETGVGTSGALASLSLTASGDLDLHQGASEAAGTPTAASEAAVEPSAADLLESVREQCTCPITLVRV